jgi:hypothetical protein
VPSVCSDRYVGRRWWLPLFYFSEVGCPGHGLLFFVARFCDGPASGASASL